MHSGVLNGGVIVTLLVILAVLLALCLVVLLKVRVTMSTWHVLLQKGYQEYQLGFIALSVATSAIIMRIIAGELPGKGEEYDNEEPEEEVRIDLPYGKNTGKEVTESRKL